jgi:RNA polymerase sigma factor (sigma-70 family)
MDFRKIDEADIKNKDNKYEINTSFYEKYNPQICAIVTRILNHANLSRDIDDCINVVFLELMDKLGQYNEMRGSMGAFVAIVTRSAALNYCRSNICKNSELIGDDKIDFLSEPIEIENKVEFEMLVKSIKEKLNEQECVLFTMRYILFYTPEEIAKAFHIRRNTVDKRVSRLKNKIQKLLMQGGIIL